MTDREKVIKGLESLYKRLLDAATRDKIAMLDVLIVSNALDLLKAQESVKPYAEYSEHTGTKWLTCGACNQHMIKIARDAVYPNYCPECGRAVKWE